MRRKPYGRQDLRIYQGIIKRSKRRSAANCNAGVWGGQAEYICFGDDYGTVLQKLGMDTSLMDKLIDYKGIWIELYKGGSKSGYALEQSGTTMNSQP